MLRLAVVFCAAVICTLALKDFDCETLNPNIEGIHVTNQDNFKFIISNEDGKTTNEYNYQTGLNVMITSTIPFNSFILQARVPSDATALGKWVVLNQKQRAYSCGTENDTLTNNGHSDIVEINARWIPRGEAVQKVTELEFITTIITSRLNYWKNIRSTIVYIRDGKSDNGLDDEVRKMKDYKIKIVKLEEDEQRTGEKEVGEKARKQELDNKQQQRESYDSELLKNERNLQNEKRIREELRDEEEYKNAKKREEAIEKALTPASTASTIATSIMSTMLCVFVISLF